VFEDNVFLFFDRESRVFDRQDKDQQVLWQRWKRTAIDAQIATARGAKRYLSDPGNSIFLDANCTKPFPIVFDRAAARIFKIVVAHGAKEACKDSSDANIYGSLAITYGEGAENLDWPFLVELDRNDPLHILDSENLRALRITPSCRRFAGVDRRARLGDERDGPFEGAFSFAQPLIWPRFSTS
jgi:hypothetical protein